MSIGQTEAVDDHELPKALSQIISVAFDLSKGPLVRTTLIPLINRQEHVLVVNMSYAVADGWSLGVLFKDISSCYNGLKHSTGDTLCCVCTIHSTYYTLCCCPVLCSGRAKSCYTTAEPFLVLSVTASLQLTSVLGQSCTHAPTCCHPPSENLKYQVIQLCSSALLCYCNLHN